jgi:phosphoglycerate dehydrogenase-like enzyme
MDATLAYPLSGYNADARATERVLFALGDGERGDFFPDGPPQVPGAENRWRPAGPLTAAGWAALLEEFRPTALVSCWSTPALPPGFVAENSPLRYVCHLVGSVRNLVPRAFLERGGLVTNWGPLVGDTVAEHALLLALAALRRQPGWNGVIAQPRVTPWRNATARLKTRTLIGRRVGIYGFGHVARSLIKMLRPFGVDIACFSAGVPDALLAETDVAPCSSLRELAVRSDVFFACEALNPRTRQSIDAAVLAALPDEAVFVNVGRGALADEPALLSEAAAGRIAVALDVVTHEPLGPDSPAAHSGALLSPHIAGPTHDRLPDCGRHALANLDRYLRGEPLEALVTPELYDRST